MKIIAKGFQNGAEIYGTTHQKPMPKQVSKQIMEIIKNHVSMKGKIIQIHCNNKRFRRFSRLRAQTVKVSKNIKNEIKIHPKIYEKSIQISCSKKGYPKHGKLLNK
jgi:hypothetical protein